MIRSNLIDWPGSAPARRATALLCAVAALSAALLALAAPASAVTSRAPTGFSPIDGSGIGISIDKAYGVAVDEANGNLFLIDGGSANAVDIFGATGGPPIGVASPYRITGFSFTNNERFGLAVDNSPASPNQGALYVPDQAVVRKFVRNPATEHYESVAELKSKPGFVSGQKSVAVDAQGNVFVAGYTGVGTASLVKFSPAGTQLFRLNVEDIGAASVAVDAAGDAFVVGAGAGPAGPLYKFPADAGGEIDAEEYFQVPTPGPVRGVAVDPASNALFVVDRAAGTVLVPTDHLMEFDATTLALRSEFGLGWLSVANQVAVNSAADRVYVSDQALLKFPGSAETIAVFGPPATLPGLIAEAAGPIGAAKATLNATVNPDGLALAECNFEFGTKPNQAVVFGPPVPCEGAVPADSADHPVSAALTGLSPATTYYFRIAAANANGATRSKILNFITASPALTTDATDISGTKATLNGIASPGGAPLTECFFEYGTDTAYGATVPCEGAVPPDEAEHPVSAALTHLIPNGTSYHFRLVTVAASGTAKGADKTFATKDTVLTGEATEVGPEAATLNGTLNPEGTPYTECRFEYGPDTAYGSTVSCAESVAAIGTGSAPVPVHAALAGLAIATTYHFRLVGVNADGTVKGADRQFKTLDQPQVLIQWAEQVGLAEASLRAQLIPEGLPATYRVEYGTDTTYASSTALFSAGSDRAVHIAAALLEGLQPATTYHYRFVAANQLGESKGPDHTFTTFAAPVAPAPCANDALRAGPSAALPDCRAYELVSPLEKNGGDIRAQGSQSSAGQLTSYKQSSVDGERITYTSATAFGDAVSGPWSSQYISSRDPSSGWSTHGISPPRGTAVFDGKNDIPRPDFDLETLFEAFTPDLCSAWVKDTNLVPLTADGLNGYVNLYRRDNCGAEGYQALTNQGPFGPATEYLNDNWPEGMRAGLRFQGYSKDFSHQIFTAGAALTPDAVPNRNSQLYDLHDGQLELLSILPGETANPANSYAGTLGSTIENRQSTLAHAVSDDGSRVFWTSNPTTFGVGPGQIYVRVGGAQTLPVSETVSAAPARFWAADPAGSAALFTLGDLGAGKGELYRFDTEAALAAETPTTLIAGRVSGLLGASDDLARIYFVSREDLDAGGPAQEGEPNLYLNEEGALSLVAVLSAADDLNSEGGLISPVHVEPINRPSRITPDGATIAFQAVTPLTGYENLDPATGLRYTEVYRYDAATHELSCVSCNPTGARPRGRLYPTPYTANPDRRPLEPLYFGQRVRAAATLPTWERDQYASRLLSPDGRRLYFHSSEALVPADTNGVQDVYQWEEGGTGSCTAASPTYNPASGGCVELISTGTSPQESEFYDASAGGDDVFFSTTSGIDPRDEGLIDVYDARVLGGFAQPTEAAPCEGEACQSPPAAPDDPTPASSAFEGAGNVVEPPAKPACKHGKVRRHGKCVKKHTNGQKHKKQGKKRSTHKDGGAGR